MRAKTLNRLLVVVVFACGAIAGAALKRPLSKLGKRLGIGGSDRQVDPGPYDRQKEMLRDAFTRRLAEGETMVHPPSLTAEEVARRIDTDCFLPAGAFTMAIDSGLVPVQKTSFGRFKGMFR